MKTIIIIAAFALTALFNTRAFADDYYTVDFENYCSTALDIEFDSARGGRQTVRVLTGSAVQITNLHDTTQLWFRPTYDGKAVHAHGEQVQRSPDGRGYIYTDTWNMIDINFCRGGGDGVRIVYPN